MDENNLDENSLDVVRIEQDQEVGGSEQGAVEQSCAVPYRLRNGRPEFCLVSLNNDSRWDFPRGLVPSGEPSHLVAMRYAEDMAGLNCEAVGNEPLDEFAASKIDKAERVTAFLVSVQGEDVAVANSRRRRWCFAEEAKVRIRRKPVRRLIDLAVRRLMTK